jgi:hypothetical protein
MTIPRGKWGKGIDIMLPPRMEKPKPQPDKIPRGKPGHGIDLKIPGHWDSPLPVPPAKKDAEK